MCSCTLFDLAPLSLIMCICWLDAGTQCVDFSHVREKGPVESKPIIVPGHLRLDRGSNPGLRDGGQEFTQASFPLQPSSEHELSSLLRAVLLSHCLIIDFCHFLCRTLQEKGCLLCI